ncbi:MAG TPA: hypothetical protein VFI48_06085, partial [Hyphomicrobiaceae bacterium]|nr:hypothetical protein [Hyphomicrobiaceae bacterium]
RPGGVDLPGPVPPRAYPRAGGLVMRPMPESRNYAIAPKPGRPEQLILHAADCPLVRAQADHGDPVMTLFECAGDPDPKMPRCSCCLTEMS